jgi:putative hemolysin
VDEGQPRQLRGGAIEVDGLLNLDEFTEQTGIELPEGPYETVAGYMLATLGHLPTDHEKVEVAGHVLTVLEMDGRRIARVRVDPAEQPADRPAEPPAGPSAGPQAGPAAGPARQPASGGAGRADGAAAPAADRPDAAARPVD